MMMIHSQQGFKKLYLKTSELGLVQTRDRSPGRDTEMAVPFPVTWGRDKMGTMGTWQDTVLEENNPVLM